MKHLQSKWQEIEKRKRFFELYGDNAALLLKVRPELSKDTRPHSFQWLLNKTFKIESLNLPMFIEGTRDYRSYVISEKERQRVKERNKKRNPGV